MVSQDPKQHGQIKLGAMQFAAGGAAGFSEICLLHPLDVVKTRLQLQKSGTSDVYTSVSHCFRSIYRNEGFLSFYKGILPPILASLPRRATKFLAYEQIKNKLSSTDGLSKAYVYPLAGGLAGITEALILNPFEVVKITQQANRGKFLQQKSAYATAREIIKQDGLGLRGLNKGLTATISRHTIWNTVYFGFYYNVTDYLTYTGDTISVPMRLLLGFTAGALSSVTDAPTDVAKSRIQGPQPEPGEIKYKSTLQTIRLIVKEEGVIALYKGLVPKTMRLGPAGAIMFVVYEHVLDWLKETC